MPTTKAVLSDPLTTPSYTPTPEELRLIEALYAAANSGAIRPEVAAMIDCLQLRKVRNAKAIEVTAAEKRLVNHHVSALKITPQFQLVDMKEPD